MSVFPHQLPFLLSLPLGQFIHLNYSQVNCCWCLGVFHCKSKRWYISFLGKSNWAVFQAWASCCALTYWAMALVHPEASVISLLRMWIFRKYLTIHNFYFLLDHLTYSVLFFSHLLSQILSWFPCTWISCPFQETSIYPLYLFFDNRLSNFLPFHQP